jgi:hypothetical protein
MLMIGVGIWFAFAGAVAVLAGLSGMRWSRRLRRDGLAAWAMAVSPPASAGEQPDESPRRTLIQYTLTDGRVVERVSPGPLRKSAALRPGQKVLVWYNPDDPQDVLVYGREGRLGNRAFVAAGLLFMLIGTWMAAFIR